MTPGPARGSAPTPGRRAESPPVTATNPQPAHSSAAKPRATVRMSDRGRGLLAAGVTLTLLALPLGFVDLVRLGLVVALLPVLAVVIARVRRFRVVIERDVEPPDVTVGEDAAVTLRIREPSGRGLPALLTEEQMDPALGAPLRHLLPESRAGGTSQANYTVRPGRRGRHWLGPLTVHTRDPFGLAMVVLSIPIRTEVVALPRVHPLTGLVSARGIGTEGATPAMVLDHGPDDASIRSYLEGDDLRKIHWPVTAHRGELMVRHEGRPTLRRALLILDTALFPQIPGMVSAFDWAAELFASLSAHLTAAGYAVHLLTPRTVGVHGPAGLTSLTAVVHELALTEPPPGLPPGVGGPGPHALLLGTVRDSAAAGGMLVSVVTERDETAVHDLLQARPAGSVGLLLVLDSSTGPEPSAACVRTVDTARGSGWLAIPVTAGTTVQAAWANLLASDASSAAGVAR